MPTKPGRGSRPAILIVDDEREHCELLTYILRREYQIHAAINGEQALALAQQHPLDVALVDYRMTGMAGTEVLARLRELQPGCIRVLITAYTESDILQAAINQAQVYRFVQKPFDPDFLRLDIQRAIEHRDAQQQLQQAANLAVLGRLAGSVMHDLRNCLQTLALVPPLLQLSGPGNIEQTSAMVRRVERVMNDLVAELLMLAKGETPRYDLKRQSLGQVVVETVEMCVGTPLFEARQINLHIAPELPDVPLSASRCGRMLTNLLRNAAQATQPGGHIDVHLFRAADDHVHLEVRDDGQGIAPELQERIFEPLFTTKGDAGVGLGLSICRSVMAAHGGTLTCSSKPGEGTTFVARFPLEAQP